MFKKEKKEKAYAWERRALRKTSPMPLDDQDAHKCMAN
jgi:hypothetical protein